MKYPLATIHKRVARKLYRTLKPHKSYEDIHIPRAIFSSTNKKRISIITGQLAAGGVERVLLHIIKGLPVDRFEVCIYVTDYNNHIWKQKFSEVANVIEIGPLLNWSENAATKNSFLAEAILYNRTDIVFITNSTNGYNILPAVKRGYFLRFRRLVIYDLLHTHGTPAENDAFLRISQPVNKLINKRVVISNYLKEYFCSRYSVRSSKVKVIHNGLQTVTQEHKNIQNGLRIMGVDEGTKTITYLGRLQADKSPLRLVELARLLRDREPKMKVCIVVAGDGELRANIEELKKQYQIPDHLFKLIGFTDKPLDVLAASSYTILTSNLEGLPMSLIESMSIGTPAIAPAVGGIPEIIEDGVDGWLVDFSSENENEKLERLYEATHSALNTPPSKLNEIHNNAIIKIQRDFMHMEEDYIKLFEGKFK